MRNTFEAKGKPQIIITISKSAVQDVDFQGCEAVDVIFHDYDIQDAEIHIEEGGLDIRKDNEGDYYQRLVWESE